MHYYKDMDGGVGATDNLDNAQFDAPIEIITKEEFDRLIVVLEKSVAEEYQTPEDTLI